MATINRTTVRFRDVAGIRRRSIGSYTGPASYVQPGGDPITAQELGLGFIDHLDMNGVVTDGTGTAANNRLITLTFNTARTTVTIRWYTALTTEVVNAVDLSTYTIPFEAMGR